MENQSSGGSKREQLDLLEKRSMALELRKGMTESEAVRKYNSSKGTVGRVRKDMEKLLSMDPEFIKVKSDDLEAYVMNFVKRCRLHNAVVTGPMICNAAETFAEKELGVEFKASQGWLEKFKQRNQLICMSLQGERASAPIANAEEFKSRLPGILENYEAKNILNGDEVGLYYLQSGRKTILCKGDDPAGTKMDKKRLTLYIVAAMDGHMEQVTVINTALKPRAFKKIDYDYNRLPNCIQWRASRKGWMTSELFSEWILSFNNQMAFQKRHILLFLDNFAGHQCGYHDAESLLTHVKVKWLPANCTSIVQPVDQGIGCALKIRYRKYLHEHMGTMLMMDKDPIDGIDVLRACVWISRAWNTLHNSNTVIRCFEKAGFMQHDPENPIHNPTEDETIQIPYEELALMQEENEMANPSEYVDVNVLMNEELEAFREDESMSIENELLEESFESLDNITEPPLVSAREATRILFDLETFFLHHSMHVEADWVSSTIRKTKIMVEKSLKQSKIDTFFPSD